MFVLYDLNNKKFVSSILLQFDKFLCKFTLDFDEMLELDDASAEWFVDLLSEHFTLTIIPVEFVESYIKGV